MLEHAFRFVDSVIFVIGPQQRPLAEGRAEDRRRAHRRDRAGQPAATAGVSGSRRPRSRKARGDGHLLRRHVDRRHRRPGRPADHHPRPQPDAGRGRAPGPRTADRRRLALRRHRHGPAGRRGQRVDAGVRGHHRSRPRAERRRRAGGLADRRRPQGMALLRGRRRRVRGRAQRQPRRTPDLPARDRDVRRRGLAGPAAAPRRPRRRRRGTTRTTTTSTRAGTRETRAPETDKGPERLSPPRPLA